MVWAAWSPRSVGRPRAKHPSKSALLGARAKMAGSNGDVAIDPPRRSGPRRAAAADGLPTLTKERAAKPRTLQTREHYPGSAEIETVGSVSRKVGRGSADFARLVRCDSNEVVFKDEERTGADRLMTPRARDRVTTLARLVQREWPGDQATSHRGVGRERRAR